MLAVFKRNDGAFVGDGIAAYSCAVEIITVDLRYVGKGAKISAKEHIFLKECNEVYITVKESLSAVIHLTAMRAALIILCGGCFGCILLFCLVLYGLGVGMGRKLISHKHVVLISIDNPAPRAASEIPSIIRAGGIALLCFILICLFIKRMSERLTESKDVGCVFAYLTAQRTASVILCGRITIGRGFKGLVNTIFKIKSMRTAICNLGTVVGAGGESKQERKKK